MNFSMISNLEERFLKIGFERLGMEDKNELISRMAREKELPVNRITDEEIFKHHQALKEETLSDLCKKKITEGFVASDGHEYRLLTDDQLNMLGKIKELELRPEKEETPWRTMDAGYIMLSREDFFQIFLESVDYKEETLMRYDELRNRVREAETEEELVSIAWE